jgi:hypothetical protein
MELRVILANFQGMRTIAKDIGSLKGSASQIRDAQEFLRFQWLTRKD